MDPTEEVILNVRLETPVGTSWIGDSRSRRNRGGPDREKNGVLVFRGQPSQWQWQSQCAWLIKAGRATVDESRSVTARTLARIRVARIVKARIEREGGGRMLLRSESGSHPLIGGRVYVWGVEFWGLQWRSAGSELKLLRRREKSAASARNACDARTNSS